MSNSEVYPDAWKIYEDCVRKWNDDDKSEYPTGWKYGIPNPINYNEYLYSNCPGKLFQVFRKLFYKNYELWNFRKFLWNLELAEGKLNQEQFNKLIQFEG